MEYHYRVIFRDKRSFKLNNESFEITAIVLSLSLSLLPIHSWKSCVKDFEPLGTLLGKFQDVR